MNEELRTLQTRLDSLAEQHNRSEQLRHEMNKKIDQLLAHSLATTELLEAWNSARGFLVVVRGLSRASSALLPIGVFFGALWFFLKTGHWSK